MEASSTRGQRETLYCHTCKDKLYIPIYQNQPVCLKRMLKYQRLWAWCQLCYIFQELILFTYTAVIKKGKLHHAAVYIGSTACHKEVL